MMRDNFSAIVISVLARRAGMRCSNGACRQLTSGPHTNPSKAVNIGVAAHITAASPGGPRYDYSLTSDERRSVDNGIWLCQSCSKLIDTDSVRYSVTLLRAWKQKAEEEARAALENPAESGGLGSDLNKDAGLLKLHRVCFDRPFLWEPFIKELAVEHMIHACGDIIAALTCGTLYSRAGNCLATFPNRSEYQKIEYRDAFDRILKTLSEIVRVISENRITTDPKLDMYVWERWGMRRYLKYGDCPPDPEYVTQDRIEWFISIMDQVDTLRNNILAELNCMLEECELGKFESIELTSTTGIMKSSVFLRDYYDLERRIGETTQHRM